MQFSTFICFPYHVLPLVMLQLCHPPWFYQIARQTALFSADFALDICHLSCVAMLFREQGSRALADPGRDETCEGAGARTRRETGRNRSQDLMGHGMEPERGRDEKRDSGRRFPLSRGALP